jgi:tetratricopeptide (TPR) repeat protein
MIPNSTAPIASPALNPSVPADDGTQEVPAHDGAPPQMQGPDVPGGALARLPASHDLHAQVQNAAYASPHGAGGASGAGQSKPVDPRAAAQLLMNEGNKALMAGKYKEAIELFRDAYQRFPSPKILMNLGSALLDAGQYAEAALTYEKYLDAEPNGPRAGEVREALERARSHLGGRSYTEADIAKSKELMTQGEQAVRAGDYAKALDAFTEAHELNPLAEFSFNKAFCLQKLGAPLAAAAAYRSFAAETTHAKEATQANALADKLAAQGANAPIFAMGRAGGMEWMQRGNALLFAHKYNEAVAAFQEGFRTYPHSAFILNEAAALADGGRYAEADLAYQRYLSNPDAPRADEAREAQQRLRTDHLGGREATITGVAESQRLMDEFKTLYKAGRYGEAFDALERAHTLNPLASQRHDQAVCLTMMGKPELAAQFYRQYLAERPNAPDADVVQRKIANLQGEALKLAQQAFDRGQVAFNEGRTREAASAFIEAYSHKPLPQFLYNAAASYHKGGDHAKAIEFYQRYLNAEPNAADADKVRMAIDKLHQASGTSLIKPNQVSAADRTAAQKAFDRGQLAWQQGRWTDAAQAFAEAYRHMPEANFLYNVAASLDKAGDTRGAVKAYQQYLDAAPGAHDADKVHKRIEQLLDRVGEGLMKPQ